jgi:hypothetical protein
MQRLDVQLEDDLTGGPADETVGFGIDGRAYEIDLNAKHAADFRRQLARFIEHARLARPRRAHPTARTAGSRERSRRIRLWAQAQGFDVAEHGRLPREIVARYEREAGEGQQATEARRSGRRRTAKSKPAGAQPRDRDRPRRRRATPGGS